MSLTGQDINHVTTLTHDGKVLLFGTTSAGAVYYSVKRSGFEDTALAPEVDPFGFEDWQLLRLGDAQSDASVIAEEQASLTDTGGAAILKSVYGGSAQVTQCPASSSVQVVSAMNLVYVFRQSGTDGKILVSRLVLDGMSNKLLPRLDVRFRRSKQRLWPQESATSKTGSSFDNLDFRDINGNSFFEPAVELSFAGTIANGWFSVVLVPTSESDRQRWHLFVHDPATGKLVLYSVGCGADGLFDVKDYLYGMKDPGDPESTIYRSIPGILRRTIDLPNMTIADCPAATAYDLQKEQMTDAGPQLMRDVMRVMLAVPVRVGNQDPVKTAVLDFAVAADGTLSQIDLTPDTSEIMRSDMREVITPISLFDDIKAFAESAPPPAGTIVGTVRGSDDMLQVQCKEALPGDVELGSRVKIRGTQSYDGHYKVLSVDGATFQVEATFAHDEVGLWEVVPEKQTGLVFDNMVVGTEKTADGKLKIVSAGHDLAVGDEVQISGTAAYDGVFPVTSVDAGARSFVLDAAFFTGEVANLSKVLRRGLRMDGNDAVETPDLELLPPSPERDLGRTLSAWVLVDAANNLEQSLIKDSGGMMSLALGGDGKVKLLVRMSNGTLQTVADPGAIIAGTWTHYAGTLDYDTTKAGDTRIALCRNGALVAQQIVAHELPSHLGDQVIAFDGVDDGVEATLNPPNLANKSFSVELWIRRGRLGTEEFAFWQGTENALNGGLHIGFRGHDAFTFATWGNDLNTAGTFPDTNWHHYACTYDHLTHTKRAYRDGVLVGERTCDSHYIGTGAPCIGRFNGGGYAFKGNIADVRVWNRVRKPAEIQADMARRMSGREVGLIAYWPLDNGTTRELSSAKRHGTLKGNPVWTRAAYSYPQIMPPAATGASVARVMEFGGKDDFIEVPAFATPTSALTVSLWARSATATWNAYGCLVSKRSSFLLHPWQGTREIHLSIWIGGNQVSLAHVAADIQGWHLYTGTYDGSTVRFYVDGVKVGEKAASGPVSADASGVMYIGHDDGYPPAERNFNGQLARVQVWDRARTAAEVQADTTLSLTGAESNLAGYWPLDGNADDRSPNRRHGALKGNPTLARIGSVFTIGQNFSGEIADVQVWNDARSAAEIKATMHLQLSGKEIGLAAYYRMGAVVHDETPAVVPDFSVHGRNGIVIGDPYAGARRLPRATGSGLKVVKYASDELVAVSQRGAYEESLEFRLTTSDAGFDPNDTDGLGSKLFTFAYHGKSTRGSAEILPFPAASVQQGDFQSLGGGWYRATCRVIVPDGVSLMRAFDLSNVTGKWAQQASPPANEWTALDIRKHHIRLISDAVTRDTYTDVAVLASLPAQPQAAIDNLNAVDRADRKVARLEEKITDVLVRIDVVQNNQRYINERNALTTKLSSLQTQRTTVVNERNAITGEAFNYWHKLRVKHSMLVADGRTALLATFVDDSNVDGQLFRFQSVGNGGYNIFVKGNDDCPVFAMEQGQGLVTYVPLASTQPEPLKSYYTLAQTWRFVEAGSGWKFIKNDFGLVFDVNGGYSSPGTMILGYGQGGSDNQRWSLVRTATLLPSAQPLFTAKTTRIAELDADIALAQARLTTLNQMLAANEVLATLQSLLTTTRTELTTARTDFTAKNGALLATLSQAPLATMPVLATDDRDLRTAGAVLDFAQPVGTVRLSESCEGNVLLTYTDRQGRLRTTVYDATADSRNAAFEQWLPDAVRACADVSDSGDIITLPAAVTLPASGWTCEAWVRYPLATRPDGSAYPLSVLAAATAGKLDAPLAVRKGNRLGVLLDGWFFDSGADLQRTLATGFHHLAVTASGSTASFYAGGVKVGSVKARQPALRLNGIADHVEVPAHASPTAAVTVSVWARSAGATWNAAGPLVSKRDAFVMHPKAGAAAMVFYVYVAGVGYKSAECAVTDVQGWHFYTGTYDGTCIRLYVDGEFAAETAVAGAIQASAGPLHLGRDTVNNAYLAGDIAEVAIWSAARGPSEIREDAYRALKGDETGLFGYWRMESGDDAGVLKVKDLTPNARHGLTRGAPADATVTLFRAIDLKHLGNAPPSGAASEVYTQGQQQAFRLNGTTDHVEVPAHASPAAPITVSIWARSATATWNAAGPLVCKREAFVMHPEVGTKRLQFYIQINGLGWQCATYAIPDIQTWHSYTGTFDGSNIRLYVDGVLVATTAASGSLFASSGPLYLGRDPTNTAFLNGDLGDVAIWTVARSAADIAATFNKTLKGSEAGLFGHWRMEPVSEGGVLKVKDLSPNGRHGLVKGAPLATTFPLFQLAAGTVGSPIGRLAEVRLWGLPLSETEVAVHARSSATGNEPGLLAHWPLNEATGATAYDRSSGGAAHGAMTGIAWVGSTANIGGASRKVLVLPERGTPSVNCPAVALASASFSFECWVRRSDAGVGTHQMLATLGTSGATNNGLHIGFRDNGWLTLAFWGNDLNTTQSYTDTDWHHIGCTYDKATKTQRLYVDGVQVATRVSTSDFLGAGTLIIGRDFTTGLSFVGQIAEVRVWSRALQPAEIQRLMHGRLTGTEADLLAYYPMDEVSSDNKVRELKSGLFQGQLAGSAQLLQTTSLYRADTSRVVACEYSSVEVSPDGGSQALMRRFYAYAAGSQVVVLPEQRVDELFLQWIGNTQINPTLLGYIEGAPPVPSENLTVEDDYVGATTVTLTQSEETTYTWQRSETRNVGFNLDGFIGAAWAVDAGTPFCKSTVSEGQAGVVFNYAFEKSDTKDTTVSATSSLTTSDSLTLTGRLEDNPACPPVGSRWVPKNVGYALVISGMADVYVTKLKRSGRMVSYDIRPVEGVPLDVNTITFLINPAYTLNGSLDGMVGSSPADETFYPHVPDMRAQYGSLYPASYFRLKEAYALKSAINRQDKERESFFYNFKADQIDKVDLTTPPTALNVKEGEANEATEATPADPASTKEQDKQKQKESTKETKKRKAEIEQKQKSYEGRMRAGAAFADWQLRMGNINSRAGKRNIVNTYVWDGDGGLRAEEQSFASTVEHTLSTETSHSGGLGGAVDMALYGWKIELSLVASGGYTEASSKTLSQSKSLELAVDLSGVENKGITDLKDNPLMPGEKVDRYRFMTFYLEGNTDHFSDFFSHVVDPEWLTGNDEEARSLRMARSAKPNKCWRVLHRVTYVERPALMAVGRDMRALAMNESDAVTIGFTALNSRMDALDAKIETKIGQVLSKLP